MYNAFYNVIIFSDLQADIVFYYTIFLYKTKDFPPPFV